MQMESSNSNTAIDSPSRVNKNESSSSNASADSLTTGPVSLNPDTTFTESMKDWLEKVKREKISLEARYKQSIEIFDDFKTCRATTITNTTTTTTTTMKNTIAASTTPSLAVQKRLDYCAKITAIAIAKEVAKSNTNSVNIVDLIQKDMNSIVELFEDIKCTTSNEESKIEIIKKYPELASLIRKETKVLLKDLNELLEEQLHEPLKECSDETVIDSIGILSVSTTPEKRKIPPNSTFDTNNNDSSKKEAPVENGVLNQKGVLNF
ncbi:UNVERIFIED_CONTAM: hypothetical protein RMT77_016117 [Armadillidium vulgare]